MAEFPDHAKLANISLIEELYQQYLTNPQSVDTSWRYFFEGIDFGSYLYQKGSSDAKSLADPTFRVLRLIQAYRRFGHRLVRINPIDDKIPDVPDLSLQNLGFTEQELDQTFPTCGLCGKAEAPLREIVEAVRQIYASRIGFECTNLARAEMEQWFQERIEPSLQITLTLDEKKRLLYFLNQSEILESFIHTKYVGQKRFSLEGGETLIPMLAEIIDEGCDQGMEELVIGMAHRGRLNVLTNILNKPFSLVFQEFEDTILPLNDEMVSDVKYHKGFVSEIKNRSGKPIRLHLAANSSCLESVDPIVLGLTKARQVLLRDEKKQKVGAVLIHGDASIAGQGVVYESIEFMNLPGYSTGGTIHIVVNNQIGFTTEPEDSRSTLYCTDIAKTFGCPVLHVNAEDPESCLFAAKLAIAFRLQFQSDIFIDLVCYRKYGHNEGDEPSFTQPLQYKLIRSKKPIRDLYFQQLLSEGSAEANIAEQLEAEFKDNLAKAFEKAKKETSHTAEEMFGSTWGSFVQPSADTLFEPFNSSASKEAIQKTVAAISQIPSDFHLHPKIQKWVKERSEVIQKDPAQSAIDWGLAESIAFGTLLLEQIPIRLSGQDSRRGTFSHRHAVWIDQETGKPYFPFSSLESANAKFDVYNSPLSEFACLGFEYGYTWPCQPGLTLWEAQYGDFVIGGQTIIDHYILVAEQKWARYSSLVLLLPHGYEGGGPEHSSGRMERFLQLAASNNTQVANCTTPAQYFHILRRQALRKIKKPLILFTPKSLLRLPACSSPLNEFTKGQFEEVLDDPQAPQKPSRLLICSGKIYYDLVNERAARKRSDIAILRLEQLYPVHQKKLQDLLTKYAGCPDVRWVQEEPENMGAWEFIAPYLHSLAPQIKYVGRKRSGVTAVGSFRQHKQEVDQFMKEAFE